MAVCSDQLQLLFERQQQRFKKSQLNVLDNLGIRLLNHPWLGDVTVDKLISNLHTELENDYRTYERVDETLRESLVSENESSIMMKTVALNGVHHPTTKVSDECTHWGSLVILPDMSYLNDSHVFDQISYKNEENLSGASNNDQEPNKTLIYADYSSDRLSNNETFKRFDENVSQESKHNDLISSVADPHHLISSSGLPTQCGKYVLNRVKLTVTWEYEDRTYFVGRIKSVDFADDLALLSHTHEQIQIKTVSVAAVSASVGPSIHKGKTKVLKFKVENSNPITLDGETLENVESFTYLGSIIDKQGGSDADVKARISKARTAFLKLKNI
ncbi:unnamed protein product [Schistosoma margrebowiei]|uniref:Uncharacterized protein n=1 Tax=Schistosoma margrebowiei TaxID=48269 RepID=A0A183M3K6_9TREM|nr:unnamed protein product [Schistosoma margrebowiei]